MNTKILLTMALCAAATFATPSTVQAAPGLAQQARSFETDALGASAVAPPRSTTHLKAPPKHMPPKHVPPKHVLPKAPTSPSVRNPDTAPATKPGSPRTTEWTALRSGAWDDPATWGGSVPRLNDTEDRVTIPKSIKVNVLSRSDVTVTQGSLHNEGTLLITGSFDVGPGFALTNIGALSVGPDGSVKLQGAHEAPAEMKSAGLIQTFGTGSFSVGPWSKLEQQGRFVNKGSSSVTARGRLANLGTFENRGRLTLLAHPLRATPTATFVNDGKLESFKGAMIRLWNGGVLVSNATATGKGLINAGTIEMGGTWTNRGHVENKAGGLIRISTARFQHLDGTIVNQRNATLQIAAPSGIVHNHAVIDNSGTVDNASRLDNADGTLLMRCHGVLTKPAEGNEPQTLCASMKRGTAPAVMKRR